MIKKIAFSFLIILFIISCLKAQENISNKHFKSTAIISNVHLKKGDTYKIKLKLSFEKPWYTYSLKEQIGPEGIGPIPTIITVAPESLIELKGNIIAPKPKIKYDKGFEMDVESYSGQLTFEIPIYAKKDIDIQKSKIYVVVSLQQCTDEKCLPPEDFQILIKSDDIISEQPSDIANIDKTDKSSSHPSLQSEENLTKDEQSDRDSITYSNDKTTLQKSKEAIKQSISIKNQSDKATQGIFGFLIIAMAAGAGALLTPCVFPMVPITVSFFTRRTETTKGKGLRDALIYALGIIVSFTSLGFLFSVLFGATGIQEFAKNPWVYLFIAAIFIVFAFNLFGAFELQLPTGLINKIDAKSRQGSGIGSVLLMSLTFSLASFSCTGPLVSAALIAAASGQWFYPILSMIGFSTVLAAPFFLLALFPTALNVIPKAGGWMNNVKGVLGFIVLGTSLYFISNAFSQWEFNLLNRDLFISVLIGITLLTTLYILGVFKFTHDTPVEKVSSIRMIFALIFAALTFYLITGLMGKSLGELETFLPQAEETPTIRYNNTNDTENSPWLENYEQALTIAKKTNKPIFIDFTGLSCTNCKKMERTIFPLKSIQKRMNKMVKVKLITDVRKEPYISNKEFQRRMFNSIEIPLYVILSPDEKLIAKTEYTPRVNDFIQFLNKGIDRN